MREAMRGNGSHKVRNYMQGRSVAEFYIPLQIMETPQGAEYPRTPYNHSIGAEWQKLEYMVFCQCSDIKQKKIFKAFFVVWSVAEHYKKQDLSTHIIPTNIFLTIKNYKKTSARSHFLFLRVGL